MTAEDAVKKASDNGVKSVDVYLSGPGAGRDTAVRSIANAGLKVTLMKDVTPVPHNGCRPPKKRRV
jgi:small subunit ribosomal protein S11